MNWKVLFLSTNGQKTHEETLNIPGHKGNANQNHIKIPLHSYGNGYHQEHKQQMLVRMCGKGTFIPCLWECILVQSLWKTV
jgi:hypothetical protein